VIKTFAFALSLVTAPALAQEAQCFQNDQFLVISQERTDEVGADFLIRSPAKGKIKCVFEQHDGDVLLGAPDDPLHFAQLLGHYLVLTRSTGPDGDLVIYDLEDPDAPVLDVPADDEISATETELTFWERTVAGTAENCSDFAQYEEWGMGAVIAEEQVFNAADGSVTATGEKRCSATQ
jgi:hypothetical protein